MAETKKTVNVTEAAKAVAAQTADTKTEEVKTTPAASVEESKKAPAKKTKTTAKKTTAKKASAKKTAAAKKTTAEKTTTKTPGRKAAVKETLHVQFAGKSYTTEDLVKIAKDVWKYDLKQKVGDFRSVELYVKPEEQTVYYVINGEVSGSFVI